MALQIIPGKQSTGEKKEILYDENAPQINITDTLKQICVDFFCEEIFFEDEEEITVNIVPFKGFKPLFDRVQTETMKIAVEHLTIKQSQQSQMIYFLSLSEDIISVLTERHTFYANHGMDGVMFPFSSLN